MTPKTQYEQDYGIPIAPATTMQMEYTITIPSDAERYDINPDGSVVYRCKTTVELIDLQAVYKAVDGVHGLKRRRKERMLELIENAMRKYELQKLGAKLVKFTGR